MTAALAYQLALFLGSLALVSVSSYVLTESLEKTGARFGFTEGLLGVVTALGADAPEIAASITALTSGHHDLGLGVVVGSNLFNLAALLGVSALVAGVVRPGLEGLLLDGTVAVLTTGIGGALILGYLVPWMGAALVAAVFLPYLGLVSLSPARVASLRLPGPLCAFFSRAVAAVREEAGQDDRPLPDAGLYLLVTIPALFAIVAGSQGMVNSTLVLAPRFHLPHALAGMLVIAALTGIPNAIAAARLALHGRGAAVVTESFNSNTLNIVVGVCLPALIFGVGKVSARTEFALWWLLGMTVAAIGLTAWRGGLRRSGGGLLVALYGLFVVGFILWR